MIRHDYILRMIEELRRVLAGIVALKQARRWQELAGTLDEQFHRLVQADATGAVQLSEADLVARLMQGEPTQFVRDKTLYLIALFKEAGDVAAAQDRLDESRAYYLKGLHLLLEALASGEPDKGPDFVPRVEVFETALHDTPLPARTQALLMRHYEHTGSFAKAEDALFAMLEAEADHAVVVEFGISFYERLLQQSNAALRAGNLPRPEVEAGLAELRARKAARPFPE